jgi:iron complex outermembrane receptor protein
MIGSPGRWQRQTRISAYVAYSGFSGHSLRFGLGHDDLDLYRVRTMKNFQINAAGVPVPNPTSGELVDYSGIQPHLIPHRRVNNYFYAQDEWNFARDWTLTAGLRRDNFSDFGATTNPRVALVWDAALDLTAKLLYGQAFRAPSFAEQYTINPVANGNPNLQPESIRTLEAAFAWQARRDTQLNLSLFRYNVKDSIRAVANAVAGTGSTFTNTGKLNGHGTELELVWDAGRTLRFTGNYSWQRSTDEATQTDTGYAPHNHAYVRADWRFAGNWLASPQLNWVADRRRPFGDARPAVPDYRSVDLTLRTERDRNQWGVAASVRNLFNANIVEPSLAPGSAIPNDLPMPRRSFYLQATHSI